MKIVKYPAESLLEKSVDVDLKDEKTIIFLMEMLGFYMSMQGLAAGLAAPQVGNNVRAFIVMGDIYLNPIITKRSKGTYKIWEGCLSLEAEKQYPVRRNKSITMEWFSVDGAKHVDTFTGFNAQVIQHEYDHLEGKLINS